MKDLIFEIMLPDKLTFKKKRFIKKVCKVYINNFLIVVEVNLSLKNMFTLLFTS